ncbi:MAG: hypothetical protein SGPRY_004700 [Prymnesium sp.]
MHVASSAMVQHELHHGKSGCDGNSNVPTHGATQEAIKARVMLKNPTTREVVLHLAEHKQAPSISKHLKRGWEAVDRCFFGFLGSRKFTRLVVPHADA